MSEHNTGNGGGNNLPPPLDEGIAILLYILSVFIPLAGIIGGIVLLNSPQARNRDVGRNMIIISLIVPLVCCGLNCLGAIPLSLMF